MKKIRLLIAFLVLIAGLALFNKGLLLMSMDSDVALYGGMAICGLVLLFGVEALELILHGRKKKNEKEKESAVPVEPGDGGIGSASTH